MRSIEMRTAALILAFVSVVAGIGWALDPTPAGACSCYLPQLISELERTDNAPGEPPMCLYSRGIQAAIAPCGTKAIFDDELFGRTLRSST